MRNPAGKWLLLSITLGLAACSGTAGPPPIPTFIEFNEKFPLGYRVTPADDPHEIKCVVTGRSDYTPYGLYINHYGSTWDTDRIFLGKESSLAISFLPAVIDTLIIIGYDHTLYVSSVVDGGSIIIDSLEEPLPLSPDREMGNLKRTVNVKKFYPGWWKKQGREATSIRMTARGYDEYRFDRIEITWMEPPPTEESDL